MKHGNEFFLELSRHIFTDQYSHLSLNAKWLFVVLNELEQKFTGKDEDFFFRSNEDLSNDSGMSLPTLKRAKAELLKTDLIQHWYMHFQNTETGKLSEKKVSAYRILK
jgi:hypothetical protein